MIYVLDSTENLQVVLGNTGAVGSVAGPCPYWDAIHTDDINYENIFEFKVPGDHPDAQYVTENNKVVIKDQDGDFQVFKIVKIEENHEKSGLVRYAYCENDYFEMLGDPVFDVRPTNASGLSALNSVLASTRWTVGTVDVSGTISARLYYDNALSCLQEVAKLFKGELRFRVAITGNCVISSRYVDLVASLGNVTGKRFEWRKDIQSIKRTKDMTGVVTALIGRGKGEQISEDGYGRRIDFKGQVWTTPTNPANKPLNQEWIEDPTAKTQFGPAGGTRNIFGFFTDEQETDPAILLQKTWDELQVRKTPLLSYSCNVVDLEKLSGLQHEAVRKGDTIIAIDTDFTPALRVNARVIKIARDIRDPAKTKVVLGNFIPTLADDSKLQKKINQQISDKSGVWDNSTALARSVLDPLVFELQNELRATGGFLQIIPGEGMYIYDNPDPAQATQVLKLGGGIFGVANTKTNGEWNWRTFGTGSGFVADLITTGTLSANMIRIVADYVTISQTGVAITGGKLTVTNGNNVAVIDGQYNMHKIVASGIYQFDMPAGTQIRILDDVVSHNLGYTPAFKCFLYQDPTLGWTDPLPFVALGTDSSQYLGVHLYVNVDSDANRLRVTCMRAPNFAGSSQTFKIKYFVYKEVAF